MRATAVLAAAFLGGVCAAVVAAIADFALLMVFLSYVGGGILAAMAAAAFLWIKATPSSKKSASQLALDGEPEPNE